MAYFIITDTHFGHENIKKLCNRPDNFEELIIEDWKKRNDGDVIIHLGDVSYRSDTTIIHKNIIQQLPGKKILVRGNHDKKSCNWYMNNGWDFCCDDFSFHYMNKRIRFIHKPPQEQGYYDISLFGHIHEKPFERKEWQIPISLELQGYILQPLEKLLTLYDKCVIIKE
jgi:calcineurin-like phosphoesterase family protein